MGLSISINLILLFWPLTYFCLWVYFYCSWCLVPKSRAGQILHFIFLYIFFQRLAVGVFLVFGSIFISNVLLHIESFHPLFMSGNQLTEVSPQAKSFRQYSSCDGKLPGLGSQLLWPGTFEALRACSVFILNLAERSFYHVATVLGRVGVWKMFPLFFRLFLNQGNEPDEWEALLNNRPIMAKGRRVKLNRTSEGMKTKESLLSNEFTILPVVIGKWEAKLMSEDLLVSPLAPSFMVLGTCLVTGP